MIFLVDNELYKLLTSVKNKKPVKFISLVFLFKIDKKRTNNAFKMDVINNIIYAIKLKSECTNFEKITKKIYEKNHTSSCVFFCRSFSFHVHNNE